MFVFITQVGATRNLSLISRANFKDPVLYSEQDSKPCRPVIGILSHPGDGAMKRLNQAENASNIPASYVKLVEMGGARVIPLIYNEPTDTIFKVKTNIFSPLFNCCLVFTELNFCYFAHCRSWNW